MATEYLGYDKNGEYTVIAGLTNQRLFKGKHTNTVFAPSSGYYLARHDKETGEIVSYIYTTNSEAVSLALFNGVRNACIVSRKKKNSDGDELGNPYLVAHREDNKKAPSFFGENVHFAFELDTNGKVKEPKQIRLKQDECTEALWTILNDIIETNNKNREAKKIKQKREQERVEKIKLNILKNSKFKPSVPDINENS